MLGLGVVLTPDRLRRHRPAAGRRVVRVLSAVVLRVFGPVGRMAERNALRNPRRTGATGAALMIGLALVACLSVVGSSMVASATDELDKIGRRGLHHPGRQRPADLTARPSRRSRRRSGLEHVTEYKGDRRRRSPPPTARPSTRRRSPRPTRPTRTDLRRQDRRRASSTDAYGKNAMSVGEKFAKDHDDQARRQDHRRVHGRLDRTAEGRARSPATTAPSTRARCTPPSPPPQQYLPAGQDARRPS